VFLNIGNPTWKEQYLRLFKIMFYFLFFKTVKCQTYIEPASLAI